MIYSMKCLYANDISLVDKETIQMGSANIFFKESYCA